MVRYLCLRLFIEEKKKQSLKSSSLRESCAAVTKHKMALYVVMGADFHKTLGDYTPLCLSLR